MHEVKYLSERNIFTHGNVRAISDLSRGCIISFNEETYMLTPLPEAVFMTKHVIKFITMINLMGFEPLFSVEQVVIAIGLKKIT